MSSTNTLFLPADKTIKDIPSAFPSTFFSETWSHLKRHRSAMIGLALLVFLLMGAVLCPIFSKYTYYETHLSLKNLPPGKHFWFGSDELGRSMFARIWWGARISLFVGIAAAFIDMLIGVFYGAFSGLVGGKVDEAMMRAIDIFQAIPNLLLVILLIVLMGQGVMTIVIAMALTGWINMARIVRGQILSLKTLEFVTASTSMGASRWHILIQHLIPNCIGPILTTVTFTIPRAIFREASLSFLGLGVNAPIASLGMMANDGLPALIYYPWRLFLPAVFISMTMLAFNLLGDGLRDTFDPRLRA